MGPDEEVGEKAAPLSTALAISLEGLPRTKKGFDWQFDNDKAQL